MNHQAQQTRRYEDARSDYLKDARFQKDNDINYTSALCHLTTAFLIMFSLGGLTWFNFDGDVCVAYLTMVQFFWFGDDPDGIDYSDLDYYLDLDCVSSSFVMSMRLIIAMCVITMFVSLLGFWAEITEWKDPGWRNFTDPMLKVHSTSCMLLVIGLVYCLRSISEQIIENEDAKSDFDVSFGMGIYFVAISGSIQAISCFYNIKQLKRARKQEQDYISGLYSNLIDPLEHIYIIEVMNHQAQQTKDALFYLATDINYTRALCHLTTVILMSFALGGLTLFNFDGDACVAYFTLAEFLWISDDPDRIDNANYDCVSSTFVSSMSGISLMCLITITNSLWAFCMDTLECKYHVWQNIRKHIMWKMNSTAFIMMIIALVWHLRMLNEHDDAKSDFDISFGMAFYLMAISGSIQAISNFYYLKDEYLVIN